MEQSIRPIQKLSHEVVGKIAAGEVVERPASVVKELVENSIDAGATAITVELREGGIQYLRVSDNGRGIPSGQIRMAFERHATSKMVRADDLFDIHTLGFRGEALASIAAVARVSCVTRTAGEDFGVRAQVEGGRIMDVREAATPVGTTLVVEDLFFNTPVRLKFLKKPAVEASLVTDYITRLMLSKPEIAFRFVNQGKTLYQSPGDGQLDSALFCIYGKEAMQAMHKVHGCMHGVVLDGYVGVGELSRGNRQQQSFFVNGRYFRDVQLSRALEAACQGLVMTGRFPSCALYLQMPYQQVDVNVHPNKLEVRFQDSGKVCQAVEELCREALHAYRLKDQLVGKPTLPSTGRQPEEFVMIPLGAGEEGEKKPQIEGMGGGKAAEGAGCPEMATALEAAESPGASGASTASTLPPVHAGEEAETQGTEGDMTTSREAVELAQALSALEPVTVPSIPPGGALEERFAPARPLVDSVAPLPPCPGKSAPESQGGQGEAAASVEGAAPSLQTVPETPEPQQETLFSPQVNHLRFIGIAFRTYWLFEAGERLLWVDQHAAHERILYDRLWSLYQKERVSQQLLSPQLVQVSPQERVLLEEWQQLLGEAGFDVQPFDDTAVAVRAIPTLFGENEDPKTLLLEALDQWQRGRGPVTQERMRKQVAQMACKRAIKGGDALSPQEVEHLLVVMLESGILPTCPHGRPIVVEVGRGEMEKRFKRIP